MFGNCNLTKKKFEQLDVVFSTHTDTLFEFLKFSFIESNGHSVDSTINENFTQDSTMLFD